MIPAFLQELVRRPVVAVLPSLWKKRGLFVSWGLAKNQWTANQLARLAQSSKFDWVALQLGQHSVGDAVMIRSYGLKYVVWGLPTDEIHPWPNSADGYIVQIEDVNQYAAALDLLPVLKRYKKPIAVVTTFGNSDTPPLIKPLLKFTKVALVECYIQDDPIHADIPRMLWQAHHDGWPLAWPVIGLYQGKGVDSYPTLNTKGGFSVWNAEQMNDEDWKALAG